jgi:hypothetical protein
MAKRTNRRRKVVGNEQKEKGEVARYLRSSASFSNKFFRRHSGRAGRVGKQVQVADWLKVVLRSA